MTFLEKGRYIFLENVHAAKILAVYMVLTQLKQQEKIPDTLVINTHPSVSINLGYYEDVDSKVDIDECRKHGLEVSRRVGGAGTYYANPATILATLITSKKTFKNLDEAEASWTGKVILRVYEKAGIKNLYYKHPGDIKVGVKKITGASTFTIGDAMCVISFINRLTPNMEEAFKLLKYPLEKLKDKGIKDIREYGASIASETGKELSINELTNLILESAKEILGLEFVPSSLTDEEMVEVEKIEKFMTSDEMVFKFSSKKWLEKIPKNWKIGFQAYKSLKYMDSYVAVDEKGIIQDVLITGDFLMSPRDAIFNIMDSLKGVKAEETEIIKTVKNVFQKFNIDLSGFTVEEFAKTIEAVNKT